MNIQYFENLIRATIKQGTVYYFPLPSLLSSREPHFFIVMNAKPINADIFYMLVSTTNFERVKEWCLPGTYVEIAKEEYAEFTKDSIVDCNKVKPISRSLLIEKMNSKLVKYKDNLPKSILDKLIDAMLLSPQIEESVKKIVRA